MVDFRGKWNPCQTRECAIVCVMLLVSIGAVLIQTDLSVFQSVFFDVECLQVKSQGSPPPIPNDTAKHSTI